MITTREANIPAYLYQWSQDIDGQTGDCWIAYRVLKATDRFLFVDSHPCGSVDEHGTVLADRASDPDDKRYRIPRADLQRDGSYTVKGRWETFYLSTEPKLWELGLLTTPEKDYPAW
jgi:hypothetical protein